MSMSQNQKRKHNPEVLTSHRSHNQEVVESRSEVKICNNCKTNIIFLSFCTAYIKISIMNHGQMNMHPMNTVGPSPNVGMQMQVPGTIMQQQSPQQMQPQMPQQAQQDKMDNISKVKTLMGSLRESIPMTLKSAAQILHQNHNIDSNSQKSIDNPVPRFDKNLEEFFSICDQMELHLRTALTCIQQAQSAAHYLPLSVIPSRLDSGPSTQETTLSYPQYLNTVRLQISYAKDIHDTLVAAAQNISPSE